MTAEEYIRENIIFNGDGKFTEQFQMAFKSALINFARIKCKEQRQICYEEVAIRENSIMDIPYAQEPEL